MEQIELSPATNSFVVTDHRRHESSSRGGRRFIQLRKYSPAICIVEALAIVVIIAYLLVWQPPSPSPSSTFNGPHLAPSSNSSSSACDQRKHDLKFSVTCLSNETLKCTSLPTLNYPVDLVPLVANISTRLADDQERETATLITTSKLGARLLTQIRPVELENCPSPPVTPADRKRCQFKTKLRVYLNEGKQQRIIGWGGALTDSSISTLLSLTVNGTKRLLDDYFGEDGLMFNMVRITIGGSDFSARFYTNDDLEPGKEDPKLEQFKLREEDLLYKIPILKMIQSEYFVPNARELKLFASMWSPPTWMKTNNHFNKGQLKGSIKPEWDPTTGEREKYFKALARLKIKFLEAYRERSIEFWGLTVMNEPLFAVQPFLNFNTMIFPKEDYGLYISKYLGPEIRTNSKLAKIRLMVHDDNRRYLMSYTHPVLNMQTKPPVSHFVDGVSVHGYADEAYDQMDEIYLKHKKFVLPTELCSGHLPFMEKALVGNWHRGVHYALDIIRSLQHSAAGWVDWNMVLDTTGGPGWLGGKLDSPVIVDKEQDMYHKSPMFYILGQFSRYIPPGSQKLKAQLINDQFDQHFETVTFLMPSGKQVATVVLNNNHYPVELNIQLVHDEDTLSDDIETYQRFLCEPDSVTTILYPVM